MHSRCHAAAHHAPIPRPVTKTPACLMCGVFVDIEPHLQITFVGVKPHPLIPCVAMGPHPHVTFVDTEPHLHIIFIVFLCPRFVLINRPALSAVSPTPSPSDACPDDDFHEAFYAHVWGTYYAGYKPIRDLPSLASLFAVGIFAFTSGEHGGTDVLWRRRDAALASAERLERV
ncbi:hypothetical protein B0H14DRAFT_3466165 [Mycena olivaceomarginata]|nr:hypothetical protein B0H14DRAFT_3466165 [Mycena olivaceomarginata]